MSSNIEIHRICKQCGSEFTARTTVTLYCSPKCNKAAHRAERRNEKIEASNYETQRIKSRPVVESLGLEFLTVRDVAGLLRCSIRTVYYSIECGKIKAVNFGQRITRIKRSDLDRLFEQPIVIPKESAQEPKQYEVSECYNLTEIIGKYGISEKALHEIIKRNSIEKIKIGRFAYVPKELIYKLLGNNYSNGNQG
jgi:excisionase family DNA binding protein